MATVVTYVLPAESWSHAVVPAESIYPTICLSHRVKAHLDTYHNKKPYGDRYLLKETNYAYKVCTALE